VINPFSTITILLTLPKLCYVVLGGTRSAFKDPFSIKQIIPNSRDAPDAIVCMKCPCTFACMENLVSHMYYHQPEWAHVCDLCNAPFYNQMSVNNHKVQYHRVTI
jgi:hypothetical protein